MIVILVQQGLVLAPGSELFVSDRFSRILSPAGNHVLIVYSKAFSFISRVIVKNVRLKRDERTLNFLNFEVRID